MEKLWNSIGQHVYEPCVLGINFLVSAFSWAKDTTFKWERDEKSFD